MHLVINASQAATAHTVRRYPFLKLHEEQGLSEVQRELSASHLRLYSHSGENVLFSYARRDFAKVESAAAGNSGSGHRDRDDEPPAAPRPLRAGTPGLDRRDPFPLQTIQKSGYESAAVGALRVKGLDGSIQLLQDRQLIRTLPGTPAGREGSFSHQRDGFGTFQFLRLPIPPRTPAGRARRGVPAGNDRCPRCRESAAPGGGAFFFPGS